MFIQVRVSFLQNTFQHPANRMAVLTIVADFPEDVKSGVNVSYWVSYLDTDRKAEWLFATQTGQRSGELTPNYD